MVVSIGGALVGSFSSFLDREVGHGDWFAVVQIQRKIRGGMWNVVESYAGWSVETEICENENI